MGTKVKIEQSSDSGENSAKKHVKKGKLKQGKTKQPTDESSNDSNDESYLNIKVKQEQAIEGMALDTNESNDTDISKCKIDSPLEVPVKKKKKKKRGSKSFDDVEENGISGVKQEPMNSLAKIINHERTLEDTYNSDKSDSINDSKICTKFEKQRKKTKRASSKFKLADCIRFENEDSLGEQETFYTNHSKKYLDGSYNSNASTDITENKIALESTIVETQPKLNMNRNKLVPRTQKNDTRNEFFNEDTSSDENNGNKNNNLENDNNSSAYKKSEKYSSSSDIYRDDDNKADNPKHVTKKINSKMSDCITFETENNFVMLDTQTSPLKANKRSSLLKKFLRANSKLQSYEFTPGDQDFNKNDDEIWLLKCPNGVNMTSLVGRHLSLDAKAKVKVEGQIYESHLTDETHNMAVLLSDENKMKIKNVPLVGTITFRKRIPKGRVIETNVMVNNQCNFIPLPDTKCRHPLFGPNYKKTIKLSSSVKARLSTVYDESVLHSIVDKKKKKNKIQIDTEVQELSTTSPVEISKRKRKRNSTGNKELSLKKMKKIKHDLDAAETWESEKAIEESLFNF